MKHIPSLAIFILFGTCSVFAGSPDEKELIQKSINLLAKASNGHIENKSCFACHNQAIPLIAFSQAISAGFKVSESDLKKQEEFILEFLKTNHQKYLDGKGTGGDADTAGWVLWSLENTKTKPNELTNAVVKYLISFQAGSGYWKTTSNRPPSEASYFTTNYLALRALRIWSPPSYFKEFHERKSKVKEWFKQTPPKDHEDSVFRLLCLHELEAEPCEIKSACMEIFKKQKPNGGWSQMTDLEPDAYATGTTLVGLHLVGQFDKNDQHIQKGLKFLVDTRLEDGSWLVKSRSKPFQPYYETGFPHGKDQFISVTASAWATTALILGQ